VALLLSRGGLEEEEQNHKKKTEVGLKVSLSASPFAKTTD